MVKQPTVPHNTPNSQETRKRSNSKFSNASSGRRKFSKANKMRKRGSPGSNISKDSDLRHSSSAKSIQAVHCSCERLNDELYQFISEFVSSQEYMDYLNFKRSIIQKDQEVQYDLNDIQFEVKEEKEDDKLRALGRRALRVFFLEVQIERYLEDLKNAEIVKKQEEAIATIREKIGEVKAVFLCHRKERLDMRKAKEKALINKFIDHHNIDISKMITTKRLDKVIAEVEKKLRMKRKGHKNNTRTIIEKILKEYHQNRRQEKKLKVHKRKKKKIDDNDAVMHIKGRKGSQVIISSVHVFHEEDPIIRAFKEAGVCLKEEKPEFHEHLWDKACSTDLPYNTSDKSLQESSLKHVSLQNPQEDTMIKMTLDENAKHKLGSMESFMQFEDLLEARHFFCICEKERLAKEKAEINYPDDQSMISSPERICFMDFKAGKVYSKRLILRNKTGTPVRLRFFKFYCDVEKYSIYFEVDPDEMKIVRPGLPVNFTVKFRAPGDADFIHGKMVFLTCHKSTYSRFMISIHCSSTISDVTLEPLSVSFGTIPIWKVSKCFDMISRFVKVKCSGKNAHKLIIKRVEDPLQLEAPERPSYGQEVASSSEDSLTERKNSDQLEMEQIIADILKDINRKFHIDRQFLVVDHQSEQNLKISLSNFKNPGFYFEKYSIDIYKQLQHDEEYRGTQEIMITLDVADYFIKCDPICVDFGICFYGTAYQNTFSIINTSKSTQFLSVRIPRLLNYYVTLDERSLVLKPEEKRKVVVKLLPSNDLVLEKCKYFDQDTSILYFPIEVKLTDKKYSSAPPTMQHCYAIVNDCADLTLDPNREYYQMLDGQMVLDLGKCSVTEAVSTQIVLRNSSYSKRYYGFVNLPRYVTVKPNNGFGSINAFQEIILDLFIHPQLEDFRVATDNSEHFQQDRNITFYVETVANLGRYRRKPSMSRLMKLMESMMKEMKRMEDVDLLEKIFDTKTTIRNEFDLCTCSSAILRKRSSSRTIEILAEAFEMGEFDADSTIKYEEVQPVGSNLSQQRHKKKRRKTRSAEMLKHHSDIDSAAVKTKESTDSNLKKRRKSSKYRTNSEPKLETTPAVEPQEVVEGLSRQPSLLEKKAVSPLKDDLQRVPFTSMVTMEDIISRELSLKMIFTRPLYEFTFNYLEFPVTPGGSYSMMTTELRPLKYSEKSCCCGWEKERKKPRFRSTFRIAGGTQEMRVEPMSGVLEYGESIKLTIVATPKFSDEVIAAFAYEKKRNSLYQEKMEAEIKRREESISRKAKKSKTKIGSGAKGKTKKEKSLTDIEGERSKQKIEKKSTSGNEGDKSKREKGKSASEIDVKKEITEEDIEIEILPEEIQVEYPDLYPAEIALWRSIEPYFLHCNFVCRVDYEMNEPWTHEPDVFSLETVCKVVAPDFIHDQNLQRIDFGPVSIGDCRRKIITIQNLRYRDITVTTSILRPEGGFFCPYFDSVQLPSECYLKIPITYTPTQDESVLEYMEIRAERTVYQFLLTAEAATSNVRLEPSSKVIRVVVKRGKLLEIPFEIVNDSCQPVQMFVEKVCELEGKILDLPSKERSNSRSGQLGKKKGEKGDVDRKKIKRQSFSDELTEEEIYSIDNEFSSQTGPQFFHLSEEYENLSLQESSKKSFSIKFGPNASDPSMSAKKKDKKKSVVEVNDENIGKTFVAKFNVLIGPSTFLRDFIVLGEIK